MLAVIWTCAAAGIALMTTATNAAAVTARISPEIQFCTFFPRIAAIAGSRGANTRLFYAVAQPYMKSRLFGCDGRVPSSDQSG